MCVCVCRGGHLLLLGVELETLSQRAGLRLMVLFPVQVNALSIRNVLLLSVSKQTVENIHLNIRIKAGGNGAFLCIGTGSGGHYRSFSTH